jgi:ferredoxin
MPQPLPVTIDGNEAAARVAYLTNEVIAIYPITPASPMGEWADQWAAEGRKNLWGAVPEVVETERGGSSGVWEKRNLALESPVWEPDICTQCGKCVFVCPHSVIRSKAFPAALAGDAPETFKHVPARSKAFAPDLHFSYQVAPQDCTGCGLCVEACPIRDRKNPERKALNMASLVPSLREQEGASWAFFLQLPDLERSEVRESAIPSAMLLPPLFEFSGACEGRGETPYLRLASQLFGDRMMVANATGCSSIYGGNLPTTSWTTDRHGRGPAWSNSLFEDNAEFGFGMRVAVDKLEEYARELLQRLRPAVGPELADAILVAGQSDAAGIDAQRRRVAELKTRLSRMDDPVAGSLAAAANSSSGAASGSSAATAGPTTSATAGSTMCSPRDATSTSWCWTPRCTPIRAVRRPRLPPRGRGQVLRRRQGDPQEGSGAHGHGFPKKSHIPLLVLLPVFVVAKTVM